MNNLEIIFFINQIKLYMYNKFITTQIAYKNTLYKIFN